MKLIINERGTHTTVIEGARKILLTLKKLGALTSPGVIEGNVNAKGKSIKLKKINNETFEMVIVVGRSKQTFKVYSTSQDTISKGLAALHRDNWRVHAVLDISKAR